MIIRTGSHQAKKSPGTEVERLAMEKLFLLIVGLIAVLVALVIGVRADDHQSPHAFAIITGAVGALVMLVRSIAEHLQRTRTKGDEHPGAQKAPQHSRQNGDRMS